MWCIPYHIGFDQVVSALIVRRLYLKQKKQIDMKFKFDTSYMDGRMLFFFACFVTDGLTCCGSKFPGHYFQDKPIEERRDVKGMQICNCNTSNFFQLGKLGQTVRVVAMTWKK
jgi:hypothetical protein